MTSNAAPDALRLEIERLYTLALNLEAENAAFRRLIDPRKLRSLEAARRLAIDLDRSRRNGLTEKAAVAAAKARLGLKSTTFYNRYRLARELCRDSRHAPVVGSAKPTPEVRGMKLNVGGGTPAPLLKYGRNPKPKAPAVESPTSEATGNFKLAVPPAVPTVETAASSVGGPTEGT